MPKTSVATLPFVLFGSIAVLSGCATDLTLPDAMTRSAATANAAGGEMLYSMVNSDLVRLDAATGAYTVLFRPPRNPVCCLVTDSDGSLFATHSDPRFPRELLRIDPVAGTTTVIGPLSVSAAGFAFHPTLGLIAGDYNNALYTIDKATGASAFLTQVRPPLSGTHLSDLAVIGEAIYATYVDVGNPMQGRVATGTTLLRIDPHSLAVQSLNTIGGRFVSGLAAVSDGLLAVDCGMLLTLSPSTGSIMRIVMAPAGQFNCLNDLASAPAVPEEPSDDTPPVIVFTGNAGTYGVDQVIDIACSATDGESAVVTATCPSVQQAAYLVGVGEHTVTASATNEAGLTATATATFTVVVTPSALAALTRAFSNGAGIADALCAKLAAAEASRVRGHLKTASNQIAAYINQVRAQSGKGLSVEQAQILASLAGELQ